MYVGAGCRVIHVLVGVGVGFNLLLNDSNTNNNNKTQVITTSKGSGGSEKEFPVELSPGIIAGFGFIILNCACVVSFGLFNKNFVPKSYGHVSLALYAAYLAVSFLLLFGAFS